MTCSQPAAAWRTTACCDAVRPPPNRKATSNPLEDGAGEGGAGVTGAGVTGAGVTGVGVTGVGVTGAGGAGEGGVGVDGVGVGGDGAAGAWNSPARGVAPSPPYWKTPASAPPAAAWLLRYQVR